MSSARSGTRDPVEFIETFGALWRCLMSLSTQTYAAEKLWSTQARFLRYIGRHGGISQAELARATDTAPALTGRLLQPLLERGWVARRRSKEDRREYVLELGAAGQRARRRVEEARGRFALRVVSVLDEKDREHFERMAKKLFAAFNEQTAGDDQEQSTLALQSSLLPHGNVRRITRKTSKESPP